MESFRSRRKRLGRATRGCSPAELLQLLEGCSPLIASLVPLGRQSFRADQAVIAIQGINRFFIVSI